MNSYASSVSQLSISSNSIEYCFSKCTKPLTIKFVIGLTRVRNEYLDNLDGLNDEYGIANEEHHAALINFGLNAAKIRMASAVWRLQELREEAIKELLIQFGVRIQNQIIFARQLAQQHPDSEAQLAAINHFYDMWVEAIYAIYDYPRTPAERVIGQGNGLTATYLHCADFTAPLATEIVPFVQYSSDSMLGQSTSPAQVLSLPVLILIG